MEVAEMKRLRTKGRQSRLADFMWLFLKINMVMICFVLYQEALNNSISKCIQDLREGRITTIPIVLKSVLDHHVLMGFGVVVLSLVLVHKWLQMLKVAAFESGWKEFSNARCGVPDRSRVISDIFCQFSACVMHSLIWCVALESTVKLGILKGNRIILVAIITILTISGITCLVWWLEREVGKNSYSHHHETV